jgi:hypothetical protein
MKSSIRALLASLIVLVVMLAPGGRIPAQAQTGLTATAVPPLLPLSGVLLDGKGRPMVGLMTVTLAIYSEQHDGTPLWIEVQTIEADRTGHYFVTLGATDPSGVPPLELFSSGQARWLGVQPQNQEELPRTLILSVPYALKAADADTLGGKPASAFLTATTSHSSAGQPTNSSAAGSGDGVSAAAAAAVPSPTAPTFTATANPGPGFISQATSGPPFQVSSSALNVNLNADLVDGFHATAFPKLATANTFTATQTIGTGNLNLDPSTATTGNITKNGTRFLHNFGTNNTFLGLDAGNLALTGVNNTGVGGSALGAITTGGSNTAVGRAALNFNNTGSENTAVGASALNVSTTGGDNTAVGYLTLFSNTTGSNNTAVGPYALSRNTTGSSNIALGHSALVQLTTGNSNVAVGLSALESTTGNSNTALGLGAGLAATTGSNNIYLGANVLGVAGESNTMYLGKQGTQTTTFIAGVRGTTVTGGEAVLIDAAGRLGSGAVAPGANTVGSAQVIDGSLTADDLAPNSVTASQLAPDSVTADKVAFNYAGSTSEGGPATDLACIGCVAASEVSFSFASLGANTFTATQTIDTGNLDLDPSTATTGNITKNGARFLHNFGSANTFLGIDAGNVTMTGTGNTANGQGALAGNTTGIFNTANGLGALANNTTGGTNTASGVSALGTNGTGADNAAFGFQALLNNTSGGGNTAIGSRALNFNGTGINNVAVGVGAAYENRTGSFNVAIGNGAGFHGTTGSNNIYLGSGVVGVAGEANTMYLGNQGTQTKTVIAGIRGIMTTNLDAIPVMIDSAGQLGTVSSSRRFKEDIHDMADTSRRLLQLRPVTFRYKRAYGDGSRPIQYGLIAEEVAEVFPELAVRNAEGAVETVHYETLSVLLLNELKKMENDMRRQGDRIEALERRLNEVLSSRDVEPSTHRR